MILQKTVGERELVHLVVTMTNKPVLQILYKVANVFPTPEVFQNGAGPTSWTFAAGSYNYPFQFKVSCLLCLSRSEVLF